MLLISLLRFSHNCYGLGKNKSNNPKHLSFTKNRFLTLTQKNICYIQDVKHNGKHRDPAQGSLGELSHFAEHILGPLPYALKVRFLVLEVQVRKGMQRLVL